MFTGLIECLGTIRSVERHGTSIVLAIRPDLEDFAVTIGGSVAIDGVCLSVEKTDGVTLSFSAVRETLFRTTLNNAAPGKRVNLERAMQLGGRLDGHIVQGHVDNIGQIINDRDVGGSILRTIRVPAELNKFMAEKGSVAIDGISLTIADVVENDITISFIPATIKNTTMSWKKRGDTVNIECDVLSRYLYRLFMADSNQSENSSGISLLTKLERLGY
ncbi:MAG: riboflavin synthase [Fibrobacter sp.]|nr:riboflavin synthase [Fibrobacter sp.]